MKGRMFVLTVLILALCAPFANGQEPQAEPDGLGPQIVVVETGDGCPDGAVQIMPNWDLEALPIGTGWTFSNVYSFIGSPGYDSDHALEQGTQTDSLTAAINTLDGVDLSLYQEPVYLSMCYKVFTWEPEINGEMDVSEGSFYTEEGMSVGYLWKLSNLDISIWNPDNCNHYQIYGLTTWDTKLVFRIAASNSEKLGTTFWYDNLAFCGFRKHVSFQPAFFN